MGIGTSATLFDYWIFVVPLSMGHIVSSAADGPDSLAEELDLVRNMNLAIHEERYGDAGILAWPVTSSYVLQLN